MGKIIKVFIYGAWILAILAVLVIVGWRSGLVRFPDGQNVLADGSFEAGDLTPNVPNIQGLMSLKGSDSTMPAWTVVAERGLDIAWLDPDNPFLHGIASDGSRFLDLTGMSDKPGPISGQFGGVRQTFTTKVGKKYALFFDIGVLNGGNPNFSGPITVRALIGPEIGTQTPLSPDCSFNPTDPGARWWTCQFRFTADTASTTLTIVGQAGKQYIGLDKVSVQCVAPLGMRGFCS
jgi:hypothetical protein